MTDEVRDLLLEFDQLKNERAPTEDTWQEIADYVVPNRTGFGSGHQQERGRRRFEHIYDGTPASALDMYASGSMGYLLSSTFDWFSLRIPDERLMDVREVRMWLSQVDQVLYGMIARSNFYRELFELFYDGGSIGTATVYRYWDAAQNRENFISVHPREVYVAEDQHGEVDTIFRHTQLTNRQIVQRFSRNGDTVPAEIEKAARDPQQMHAQCNVLHAVKPNERYDPRKRDSRAKKYKSIYLDLDHEEKLRQRGYDSMPYATWRVQKQSDECYGRGPGWNALSDIKALYEYARTDINAAQLVVNKPLDIPEERRGQILFQPGGHNYYDEAGREIRVIDPRVELRAGLDREERKQRIIERHYMVDFFMMFAQSEKEMTATEIRQRREEKAILLGPHITGLNQDVLDKIIDGIFVDAWNAGMIPRPPDILMRSAQGRTLEVDYQGPLVQAQRNHFEGEPYRQWMQQSAAMAEILVGAGRRPDFLDNYNLDRISREMAKAGGLPEEDMFDERIVAQIREARQQQMQRQQQLAAMEQMGKAAPGLNEPVQEGSPLQQMQEAAG